MLYSFIFPITGFYKLSKTLILWKLKPTVLYHKKGKYQVQIKNVFQKRLNNVYA